MMVSILMMSIRITTVYVVSFKKAIASASK